MKTGNFPKFKKVKKKKIGTGALIK